MLPLNSRPETATFVALAADVRSFLEPVWPLWHQRSGRPVPTPASAGTCGRSSLFLRDVLRLEGFCAEWTIGNPHRADGGEIGTSEGFFTGMRWESHAWVSCLGMIIDVTADQFGADAIIVTTEPDARYRANGHDAASRSSIEARHSAVAFIWPEWLAHRAKGQNSPVS
jgi:hypothetical protein